MSTKTTFKRIALVAVAALGLGMLSVAPSTAATSGLTVTVANGTAGASAGTVADTTTAALATIAALTTDASDTISVSMIRRSAPSAGAAITAHLGFVETSTVSTAVGALITSENGMNSVAGFDSKTAVSTGASDGYIISGAVGYKSAKFSVLLDTATVPAAGDYVYTIVTSIFSPTGAYVSQTLADVTITVAALATASTVVNAGLSSVNIAAGASAAAEGTADAAVSGLATASGTPVAALGVYLKNAAGGNATESVTVTITGPGTVGTAGGAFGKSLLLQHTAGAFTIQVRPDGTAGTASIAVSTPSATFAPKTVTFYAAAASTIAAVVNKPVISVSSNTAVVYAQAKDANGTSWGGVAYIYASTAADALIAGSATTPVACTYVASDDVHACPVSGTTIGTAKFKVIDASTVAAATATSNEVSDRVTAGVPTTVKLAFDKATYAPGEKAQVQILPLDAAGLTLSERTISNIFAAGGISSSTAFSAGSDTLTATSANIAGATSASAGTVVAHQVYTVYMPMSSGTVTISATGGTGLAAAGRVAVSASAEVVNTSVDAATDAANEATDAANAATDAALASADAADAATAAAQDASDAVAALSTRVSSLIKDLRKQIRDLTKLVQRLL